MTSRQRMLAALECRTADHLPCAFMMYKGLKNQCRDYAHFLQAQLNLGLDVVVELPPRQPVIENDYYNLHGLPVYFDPRVRVLESRSLGENGDVLLAKEYRTPAGSLNISVAKPSEWRWGDHIPFLDDHIIPVANKPLVETIDDLAALKFLLVPPTLDEVNNYQQESMPYLELARKHDLLVAGGWGVGADMVGWLCGLKKMISLYHRQPDFMQELLGLIATWNRERMRACFTLPLDLYIKRAWYENCDFWTPSAWKQFILPHLAADVALAHQSGVKFGYLLTSHAMPLIGDIIDAGVDVLIGVDPREYDLALLAQKACGRMCLWGGVNGHLTMEMGSPEDVTSEVQRAVDILKFGGFILSPVDNIRQYSSTIAHNVKTLISTWRDAH